MITYGTNPGMGMAVDAEIPADADPKALKYMGFEPGETLQGQTRRLRLRRQLHQRPHRGPAPLRTAGRRPPQGRQHNGVDRPRLERRRSRRKGRGTGPDSGRRGIRTPPAGLFGLSGDERRQDSGGQILRFDLEPQFRRASGAGRTDDAFGHRGGRRRCRLRAHRRPTQRCLKCKSQEKMSIPKFETFTSGGGARPHGKHRYRPDHPGALSQSHRAQGIRRQPLPRLALRRRGPEGRFVPAQRQPLRGPHTGRRPQLPGAAVRANTPHGPSPTTASASWCRVSSPTSSATTPSTTVCCRSR